MAPEGNAPPVHSPRDYLVGVRGRPLPKRERALCSVSITKSILPDITMLARLQRGRHTVLSSSEYLQGAIHRNLEPCARNVRNVIDLVLPAFIQGSIRRGRCSNDNNLFTFLVVVAY